MFIINMYYDNQCLFHLIDILILQTENPNSYKTRYYFNPTTSCLTIQLYVNGIQRMDMTLLQNYFCLLKELVRPIILVYLKYSYLYNYIFMYQSYSKIQYTSKVKYLIKFVVEESNTVNISLLLLQIKKSIFTQTNVIFFQFNTK